jgi:hypothetical protein
MKLLLALFGLASVMALAQTDPGPTLRRVPVARPGMWSARPWLYSPQFGNRPLMKANLMTEEGMMIILRGDVDITIDAVRVQADKAVYHKDNGEIEPEGHVRITRSTPNK